MVPHFEQRIISISTYLHIVEMTIINFCNDYRE
ncbi:hypothetical protein V202x_16350 [Gimesia aquarii]|uniref:Uncharacterized protein n=1 Tax=Gimesia aquarii TaxID=2527964 RepID=A0A517WSM5_9PLAN|nr:hypothetical protein V202x_16350 [Gimesia aquarii]